MASSSSTVGSSSIAQLQTRLDSQMKVLNDSLRSILSAAKVQQPLNNAREEYQLHIHAANIVKATENTLALIRELKQWKLLHDAPSRISEVKEAQAKYQSKLNDFEEAEGKLMASLADSIRAIEDHLAGAPSRACFS